MYQRSFIYHFLLTPRYKIWRYLGLVIFFIIVSLNQTLAGYNEIMPSIEDSVYWIIAATILVYIVGICLVLSKFRRYLSSGKYIQFVFWIICCSLLFMIIPNTVYLTYEDGYSLSSPRFLIDNLSAFVTYILCILGVIIPVFLRNWMLSNQRLSQLKIKQKLSQVEQLKEQVNPASFFKILNRSRSLVKSEPDLASLMLMKLSQLLRYQLYDCNRSQVLLSAEISFLENFLKLEKLYSSKFDYAIDVKGNIDGVFIFPSILLPYVQSIINSLDNKEDLLIIDIQIINSNKDVYITLHAHGIDNIALLEKELLKVQERLNTLYGEHYTLTVRDNQPIGEIEIILQLEE
ncbi:histidine kinase [Dysgonomonas sp. Marseille-P4677]|uniref:histidine kinase n=1 Tax=Dysgonomonas sp. Marseille-P4677 TaxID=2364790 RepID=UPI0019141FE2|nr:histidine kinase [Dysgonomonas sp. Marseille-P4677]MBK5720871.1 histidine kinase [Dysgonomonas sp. Marseille-P4677]